MPNGLDLSFIRSLYGGYWNYGLKDFCYMINQYFPPQEMLDKIAGSYSLLSRNYPSTNRHISSLLANCLNTDPDNIVIANGASELISAIGHLFITNLAIPIPTFEEYINRLKIQGKGVSLYEMEKEGFILDIDVYIKFAEQANSNAVLFIRPDNPSGNLIPKTTMRHILERLVTFDVVLVDESFIEFASTEKDASIQEYVETYENLIIIKSLSKAYGIPGLRIGCAISANTKRMNMLREELPIWNLNSFAQRFIELLKDYRNEFEDSCLKTVRATKELDRQLHSLECLYPYPTEANFVLCRLKGNSTSSELTAFLFDHFNMLIYDGSAKIGLDSRFVRIASRTEEENIQLIEAIKTWNPEIK